MNFYYEFGINAKSKKEFIFMVFPSFLIGNDTEDGFRIVVGWLIFACVVSFEPLP